MKDVTLMSGGCIDMTAFSRDSLDLSYSGDPQGRRYGRSDEARHGKAFAGLLKRYFGK